MKFKRFYCEKILWNSLLATEHIENCLSTITKPQELLIKLNKNQFLKEISSKPTTWLTSSFLSALGLKLNLEAVADLRNAFWHKIR